MFAQRFITIFNCRYHTSKGPTIYLVGGGYGFLFHSEIKKIWTTQELKKKKICHTKHEFFFQNSTLGYMTKTLIQIIIFFLHQNQNIFFSNIGNQNIFLEKWSFPNHLSVCHKHTSLSPIIYQSVDNCCIIINTLINHLDPIYL